MKTRINKSLWLVLLALVMIPQGYAQTCETVITFPANDTVMYNGIQVTTSGTRVYEYPGIYTSCSIYKTPVRAIHLGRDANQFFEFTMRFSSRINHLRIVITATGHGVDEDFTFTSNGGTVHISSNNSCYSRIVGNTLYSGLNSPQESGVSSRGGGGGWFEISTPEGFTELTISGIGKESGSMFAFCRESIVPICQGSIPNDAPATAFTATGISDLQGFNNNWPQHIPNGFLAIASKNQGFVITRVRTVADIPSQNLVEGMLVYDIRDECVKLYNGSVWHCIEENCSN